MEHPPPDWFSLLPPLFSVVLALTVRNVVVALFGGVWLGAWGLHGLTPWGLWQGLLSVIDVHVRGALADPDHAAILLFSFLIAGMVGIIRHNGGLQGAVDLIVPRVKSRRGAQVATGLFGLGVFFDDYANLLVVGNAMGPLTRRLRVSREKLAYLIDSTAAPVACLAFVTTWIGFEVGLIEETTRSLAGIAHGAYGIFLRSLPFCFYPLLALFFVFLIAITGRDFGPMWHAEQRAVSGTGTATAQRDPIQPEPDQRAASSALNAVLPVVGLVIALVGGLYATGSGDSIWEVIGSGDSFVALMWASMLAVLIAAVLSLAQRLLSLAEVVEAWHQGLQTLLFGLVTLVLAWALAGTTEALGTAEYLSRLLGPHIVPAMLPIATFLLAAGIAFATGSAWGTMAILLPIAIPLAWNILSASGAVAAGELSIFYGVIASVLSGGVWGDHCSPISDTTVLSSAASDCDHIAHVRTQLPYALVVGATAIVTAAMTFGLGISPWLSLATGSTLLVGVLLSLGKATIQTQP